ncbi:hypothetical protein GCM10028799_22990 [Kribbella italica]
MATALTGDLVRGGERDQVREALERDGVPVVHVLGDGVGERNWTRHRSSARISLSEKFFFQRKG